MGRCENGRDDAYEGQRKRKNICQICSEPLRWWIGGTSTLYWEVDGLGDLCCGTSTHNAREVTTYLWEQAHSLYLKHVKLKLNDR